MKALFVKVLLFLLCIFSLGWLSDYKYLYRFFDDWEAEVKTDLVYIIDDEYLNEVYDSNDELLYSFWEMKLFQQVFCRIDYELYYCYYSEPSNLQQNWNIAAVNVKDGSVSELFSLNLFEEGDGVIFYEDLSLYDNASVKYGGLCNDTKVFFRGSQGCVVFDPSTDITEGIDNIPACKYSWEISEDKQTLQVIDEESGEKHELTLASMASGNKYAEKILSISNRKTIFRDSPVDELFSYVKIIDDTLFIVCDVKD